MSILNYFVKDKLRARQAEVLSKVEENWRDYDVFCIQAPTGTGKTAIAETIVRWAQAQQGIKTANILAPENVQVDHYENENPDLMSLKKAGAYTCKRDDDLTCGDFKPRDRCKGCVYNAQKRAVEKAPTRLMNYHVYQAHGMRAELLVFDEAHKLPDVLYGMFDYNIWSKDYNFPNNLRTIEDVVVWIESVLAKGPNKKLEGILRDITSVQDNAIPLYERKLLRGRPYDVLVIRRLNVREQAGIMWPGKTKKIVLMSATINEKVLQELGLDKKRFITISCDSEIPAANREFRYVPKYRMTYSNVDRSIHLLARAIRELLAENPTKGLIHLPYNLATQIRAYVEDDRLLWHTKGDKKRVFAQFKHSDPEEGKVMVASGLYTGVDLPYDEARWQLIGKVPYPSLGDPFIQIKSQRDPEWYAWQTIKIILQAAGRIVRAPEDYGVTYMFDTNFESLYTKNSNLFPRFFKNAVRIKPRTNM